MVNTVCKHWSDTPEWITWTNALHNRCYMCIQWTRVLYCVILIWQFNPPISQFNSPCNEFLVNVCIQYHLDKKDQLQANTLTVLIVNMDLSLNKQMPLTLNH